MLYLDFETKSTVDLKKAGADVYARHPSTDILCVGFAYNDGPVLCGRSNFHRFKREPSHKIIAQNAPFELAIWNNVGVKKYGWQPLDATEVECTMAMSYSMALPGSLAESAPASGLTISKDSEGHRIMMQLSRPRSFDPDCVFCNGKECDFCVTWYTPESHPDKFEKLYSYCKQDVEVERQIYKRLLKLSPSEKKLWEIDYRINQRGVQIDVDAVRTAVSLVEAEKKRLDLEIQKVTKRDVGSTSAVGQLTGWLEREGFPTPGVAKGDVALLLGREDLPPHVRRALEIRQEAAKASTSKLKAMLAGVCTDHRLRGMFQYHGAGATGRWAGRRVQLQNLKRQTMPQTQIEEIFKLLGTR